MGLNALISIDLKDNDKENCKIFVEEMENKEWSLMEDDWESVKEYAKKIDNNKVFISTSILFQEIESKYCNKTSA